MYNVIIIGAGPAGMAAGIYTCRKKLKTLILSKDIGGQMTRSWSIENYLGYHLISGMDLAMKFKEHLDKFGCAELQVNAEVVSIKKIKNIFELKLKSGISYQSKTVIITSGKKPRELGIPGEHEFLGRGLTYCATCDAPLFKNKVVAVIGGGNSALEAVYQLGNISKEVYLLIRSAKVKENVDKVLLQHVRELPNVKIIFNAQAMKISGDKVISSLEYQDILNKETNNLTVSGIFVEIGSVTSVDFCHKLIKLNRLGEIKIDRYNMTSMPGIFAAGDVTDVVEKQTIIAAGEGAKAAIAVANYLSRQR